MTAKQDYRAKTDAIIRDSLDEMQCQPILFIGSGFSQRYSDLPTWIGLLKQIAASIGMPPEEFTYLSQKHDHDAIKIGTSLTDLVFEWAWGDGKKRFPEELFSVEREKSIFIKHLASELVDRQTKDPRKSGDKLIVSEVELLSNVKPHAIITTNYDRVLSGIFDDYEEIIGQKIIRSNLDYFGEIFKIHGCVSDPSSLVINSDDYVDYRKKRKYLSAKLLTYLSEHPVFIFGYSVSDPNVIEIIDDVGEVLGSDDQLIPNLFHVSWNPSPTYDIGVSAERLIAGSQGRYRVRSIETEDFAWVYQSLAEERELSGLNTKLLRALLSRTYNLIRSDIPRRRVEVNYETLEHAVGEGGDLPSLLGISKADNTNMTHPYVLTQVAQKLGYNTWHPANRLLDKIKAETGIDLKKSDNRYHCRIKVGSKEKSSARKWSDAGIDLLAKVAEGKPYKLDL